MYEQYRARSDAALWEANKRMQEQQKVSVEELQKELERRALMGRSAVENRLYVLSELERVFALLRSNKPNDRSEADRCWAIATTDMQKLVAFFKSEVVNA